MYVNERQKIDTIALGLLKNEEEEEYQIAIFLLRAVRYINCAIIAMLYTHSIGNQP